MKRVFILVVTMAMVLVFSMQAHAALQNLGTDSLGNRLIYDTDFDITWYDYTHAADTWDNQVAWASGLSVTTAANTYTDWRLPTALNQNGSGPCNGYNCTGSEMGHLYFTELGNLGYPTTGYGLSNVGDFQHLLAFGYHSGTQDASNTINAWYFSNFFGYQSAGGKAGFGYAIAVRPGLAVVPEPVSAIYFVVGGASLGLRRFWKKREIA